MRKFDSELFETWEDAVNGWLEHYPDGFFTLGITPSDGSCIVAMGSDGSNRLMWNPPLKVERLIIKNHKSQRVNRGVTTYMIGTYADLRNIQKIITRKEKINSIFKNKK